MYDFDKNSFTLVLKHNHITYQDCVQELYTYNTGTIYIIYQNFMYNLRINSFSLVLKYNHTIY